MKAKIFAREANWPEAKILIKAYSKKTGHSDKEAQDVVCARQYSLTRGSTD